MKIWLEINRRSGVEKRSVTSSGSFAIVQGKCPGCSAEPFTIAAGNRRRNGDTYVADSRCRSCNDPVGYVYAKPDTLFGLEEDEAVTVHGRARVY